jgi:hypothetical protein
MKKARQRTPIVRRSIALPKALVDEVTAVAPAQLRQNFNRLVSTALHAFLEGQRAKAFEAEMQAMAADPQIRAGCKAIEREFAQAASDGLRDD